MYLRRVVRYLIVSIVSVAVLQADLADKNRPGDLNRVGRRDLRYIYGRYEIPVTNDGRFGWDPEFQVPGGGRWPRGTNEGYIFGAGIWIGAIVNGVKQVTVGYNPTNIQTEMVPGSLPNEPGYTDPTEIVYVSTDYPNPSLPPWPRGFDSEGRPITVSQMDSWSQCNDLDSTRQFETGRPLGVLLTVETFSWNSSFRDVWDVAFIRYTIKNIDSNQRIWTDAYIGFAMDADIGDPTNDLTGAFPDLNIGYTYSAANLTTLEQGLEHPPGYVGIKFLDGPAKDPVTGAAKMSAFVKWASELNPNTDEVRYDLLARGTYDLIDTEPADKRMLISSGPFTLDYGDSTQFIVAIVFAWPEWYYNPSVKGQFDKYADYLKLVAANAQYVYDNNYRFPQPPDLPRLTLLPQDRTLVIAWDDVSERTIEDIISLPNVTDPHDFEGYRLWKSLSGTEGTFELLGEWDLIDYDDLGNPIGKNTGLSHSYVDKNLTNGKVYFYAITAYDRGEYEPLHYGDPEYEAVPPLETGMLFGINLKAESPNVPPSNFTAPGLTQFNLISGNASEISFSVSPSYLVRDSVRTITYQIVFKDPPNVRIDLNEPIFGPDIFVVDVATQDTVSSTLNFPIGYPPTSDESDFFNGMTLTFTGPNLLRNTIDSVYFMKPKIRLRIEAETDFTGDYLDPRSAVVRTTPLAFFFQPHTYLFEFLTAGQVSVSDVNTGEQLRFELRTLGRDYGIASYERTVLSIDPTTGDTTWTWFNNPPGFRRGLSATANGYRMYVPGAFVFIEDLGREIQPGDSLYIRLAGVGSPRAGNAYQFQVQGSTINYSTDLSVIKVVPNPYLVRAPWDIDNDYQRVQFINLPTECTIRIYTIAGDLVKTLAHLTPYSGGFDGQTAGTAYWNLQTENSQKIATGVYIFHVESPFGETTGRFAVIR